MNARVVFVFPLLGALTSACTTNGTPLPTAPDAGDAASAPQCVAQGDRCGPDEACCGSVTGHRVHLAENCAESIALIACVGASTPGERCKQPLAIGCMARVADGTEELFVTTTLWTADQVPGLTICPDDVRQRAFEAYRQPCK